VEDTAPFCTFDCTLRVSKGGCLTVGGLRVSVSVSWGVRGSKGGVFEGV
jgi:hypothetical protein